MALCSGYVQLCRKADPDLMPLDPSAPLSSDLTGPPMRTRILKPYRHQRDLFEVAGRLPTVACPVCNGMRAVPFWSRQGKVPVIGGKQVPCETCTGTGRVPAA